MRATELKEYNPIAEFFARIGFGAKEILTAKEIAEQELEDSKIALLQAERDKEAATCEVEKLKMRMRRLEGTLRDHRSGG